LNKKLDKADYTYATFKNEIEEALVARFGRVSVVRGNKLLMLRKIVIELKQMLLLSLNIAATPRKQNTFLGLK